MSTHAVQVDEETLRASLEADAAIPPPPPPGQEQPGPAPGAPGGEAEAGPTGWGFESKIVAAFICRKLAPNWEVPPETEQDFSGALQECADKLMPGGLGNVEAWGPWGKLLFATLAVGMAGVDLKNFTIKPLQKPPINAASHRTDEAPTHTAAPSGKFTTSG